MRIKVVEEDDTPSIHQPSRIEEIEEGELVKGCFLCNDGAKLLTTENDEVRYCSDEHRRYHQPEDDEPCFPFVVKYRPSVGRYEKDSVEIHL